MSHAQENRTPCKQDGCDESVPSSKHDRIQAQEAGWFFQVNGDAWCPAHTPAWVKSWRAARKESSS